MTKALAYLAPAQVPYYIQSSTSTFTTPEVGNTVHIITYIQSDFKIVSATLSPFFWQGNIYLKFSSYPYLLQSEWIRHRYRTVQYPILKEYGNNSRSLQLQLTVSFGVTGVIFLKISMIIFARTVRFKSQKVPHLTILYSLLVITFSPGSFW